MFTKDNFPSVISIAMLIVFNCW